ncbi:hypothetical protein [Phenylobacterium sp.]|uniref:hypothetical protein n=1 Tax=Phenylobacterium sp. TaxID=1871053 RepID=UPI0028962FBD|nr:hypothetical protein [Phenylobacterium sp.]
MISRRFADVYLHGATLLALAPAVLVAVGVIAPRLGLMSEGVGIGVLAMAWAPQLALAGVAAGILGVAAAVWAGLARYWLRALLVLAITTATLCAYVWDRQSGAAQAAPPAAEVSPRR